MKYRMVTTGEIHSGFSLQEVQKNLGHQSRTDIYGERLMIWEAKDGFITTTSKATPGQSFIVLWMRKEAGASNPETKDSGGVSP